MKKQKKQYSAAERKAFWMGVGAGVGNYRQHGKFMMTMPNNVKASFQNGMDKGLRTTKSTLHWKRFSK